MNLTRRRTEFAVSAICKFFPKSNHLLYRTRSMILMMLRLARVELLAFSDIHFNWSNIFV